MSVSWWRKGTTAKRTTCITDPLGGAIEFGEHGDETVKREFREEIGADLSEVRYLGHAGEYLYAWGRTGTQIVLVYDGR